MSTFSEQISSNKAVIRFDVVGGPERTAVAEDMSFLNYRLGSVEVSHEITKEQPDIIWYYDEAVKSIRYENEQLILTSFWEEGDTPSTPPAWSTGATASCWWAVRTTTVSP